MVNPTWSPVARVPVIPPGWEELHQPTVAGTWTARVRYWTGPNEGDPDVIWDPTTKTEQPNRGTVLYDPADALPNARIQQHPTPTEELAGQQQVTIHRHLVVVPKDWDSITLRGWIEVLTSSDGDLTGDRRWLRVTDILHGSLRWERDLICTTNLG